jgi:hypothetical protein
MINKSMEKMLKDGEALDLSKYPKNADGDAVLPPTLDIEGLDLCYADTESWIWSVGKNRKTGEVLASTSSKFYGDPAFECLWLR